MILYQAEGIPSSGNSGNKLNLNAAFRIDLDPLGPSQIRGPRSFVSTVLARAI